MDNDRRQREQAAAGLEQLATLVRAQSWRSDGTLNGMQALSNSLPTVLAPKTIDNDLGLNYRNEPDEFTRQPDASSPEGFRYARTSPKAQGFHLDQMVNYVTPGYATAVFVSNRGIQCVRSTAESHRRVAIIEVMGRYRLSPARIQGGH